MIALFVAIVTVVDLNGVRSFVLKPVFIGFGLPTLGSYLEVLGLKISYTWQGIVGVLLLMTAVVFILTLERTPLLRLPPFKCLLPDQTPMDQLSAICATSLVFCYMAGSSYDYRLFLLLVAALGYIRLLRSDPMMFWTFSIGLLATMWASAADDDAMVAILQPIGDLANLF